MIWGDGWREEDIDYVSRLSFKRHFWVLGTGGLYDERMDFMAWEAFA
jgi:hypothetical protein